MTTMVQSKKIESSPNKVRVQFDFNKKSLDKLDELVDLVGAGTRAEVIRRALTLFTELLSADQRGAKLMLREQDGQEKELLPLF